jgi:transcriptional regulator with XRE-family HTH domain
MEEVTGMAKETLGELIRARRGVLGLSAQKAARRASMSTAYLLRLEEDKTVKPSPMILNKVAGALEIDYVELMRRAGYLLGASKATPKKVDATSFALFGDLSEQELDDVTQYIRWRRAQRDEKKVR